MGGAVFPPRYLTWCQTIMVVMKIMATSFKRSHACTATLSAPSSAAGHHQPTTDPRLHWRLLETLGKVWVSVLWGHCSFLLGPECTQVSVCALQESISQSCVSSGSSMMGLLATSSKRAYAIPKSAAPRAPAPAADYCWPVPPQETLKHSLSQSLWSLWVLVHTRFVWALWASLAGMGFDSKCILAPPTILLGLLLCPWTWGISLKLLLCHTAAAPVPTILLGFSDPGPGESPQVLLLLSSANLRLWILPLANLIPACASSSLPFT